MEQLGKINVDLVLRELETAKARLVAQQQLAENSQQVLDQAIASNGLSLARIARVRLKRHKQVIMETTKVIAELEAMLPPPQPQLDLSPANKPSKKA